MRQEAPSAKEGGSQWFRFRWEYWKISPPHKGDVGMCKGTD